MNIFLLGLVIFFIPHLYSAFRSREEGRDRRKNMGENKYMGLYSVVALIGFVLMIKGFGDMRPSQVLYEAPSWGFHANTLLTPIALILFIASQFPAGHIKKRLKHPMLVSIKLWALGHLLSNGELNSVILFGAFLAFAVIDRIRVKRRGDMGAANAVATAKWDVIAVILGVSVTVLFVFYAHPKWIGVPVMP